MVAALAREKSDSEHCKPHLMSFAGDAQKLAAGRNAERGTVSVTRHDGSSRTNSMRSRILGRVESCMEEDG